MANQDSTVTPIRPKVEPIYFETDEGQPSIYELVNGLDGVCSALDRMQPAVGDADDLQHIAQLSCAASILARQLSDRWYGSKPPSRRQIEAARKASDDFGRLREAAAS
jgi:hypothetical protein